MIPTGVFRSGQVASQAPRHSGPPITPDDLLDFHHLLDSPDWFEGLQRLVGEAKTAAAA